jgi:hypothetical protein
MAESGHFLRTGTAALRPEAVVTGSQIRCGLKSSDYEPQLVSDDPSLRLVVSTFVKGSRFGVQKHSRRIDDPMLPAVTDDDGDALNARLMILNETRVGLKSRVAFPTVESGNVDQQPNLPALRDHCVDTLREALEVPSVSFSDGTIFSAHGEIASIFIISAILMSAVGRGHQIPTIGSR